MNSDEIKLKITQELQDNFRQVFLMYITSDDEIFPFSHLELVQI